MVTLPVQVGPFTTEVTLQVLDRELGYNMLLGHPWIHAMKAVPSTFHQCVKFPCNGIEITIHGDPDPFQFCNHLKDSVDNQVPISQAAPPTALMESLVIPDTRVATPFTLMTPSL